MMGIYIVEDDDTMIEILEDMIEEYELAEVVGATENGMPDVDEILDARPDIVLIDFLMPGKDGAELVRELRNKGCGAHFIMISQVSSKDMIAKAYEVTVSNTQGPSMDYANKVLENWHSAGYMTPEEVDAARAERKAQKSLPEGTSFSTDEFFEAALLRSYGNRQDGEQE